MYGSHFSVPALNYQQGYGHEDEQLDRLHNDRVEEQEEQEHAEWDREESNDNFKVGGCGGTGA